MTLQPNTEIRGSQPGSNVLPFPRSPSPAGASTTAGLCQDDAELISAMRKVGIRRIYGIFDYEAWLGAIRAAELYSMPFEGKARADLRAIEAAAWRMRLHGSRPFFWQRNLTRAAIRQFAREGTLLRTIFPEFSEAASSPHLIDIAFPKPPREELSVMHRARLAGFTLRAAVPEPALSAKGIADVLPRISSRATDPIIFGFRERDRPKKAVVFGYYGASPDDALALRTLTSVLDEMAMEI